MSRPAVRPSRGSPGWSTAGPRVGGWKRCCAAATSRLKIEATESAQKLTELFVDLAAHDGLPVFDRAGAGWADAIRPEARFAQAALAAYLFTRAQTIYGGTTEVQKNIIARMLV